MLYTVAQQVDLETRQISCWLKSEMYLYVLL